MTTTTALKLSEADVERSVCDLLIADGWRCFKMERQFSEKKRKAIGEEGMPDRLFIRYIRRNQGHPPSNLASGVAEVLWIEVKRNGKKPTKDQADWAYEERRRGALILVVDSIDEFTKFYLASGLNRRIA